MIRIIAVGKIKEPFLRDGISEYTKRLGSYTKLSFLEVPDEKCPEGASEAQQRQIREKEGERILSALQEKEYVITLEIGGSTLGSEGFAGKLQGLLTEGHSDIAFVIGGSLGLSRAVCERSDYAMSFSALTFPHQLMRLILLEQIYRAFKIARKEPYHK